MARQEAYVAQIGSSGLVSGEEHPVSGFHVLDRRWRGFKLRRKTERLSSLTLCRMQFAAAACRMPLIACARRLRGLRRHLRCEYLGYLEDLGDGWGRRSRSSGPDF